MFVYGGALLTAILNDKQDIGRGYLHDNFVGELDWPAAGALVGGGLFVTNRVSVGGELTLRQALKTQLAIQSGGHFDREDLTGLYTSDETLLSFVGRLHSAPLGRVDLQPLGGLTVSRSTRTLTGQHGFYTYPNITPIPISRPDAAEQATKFGLVGGVDIAVRLGRGVAVVAAPRLHWINRDRISEYEHVVPNAGRVVTVYAVAVQWRPLVNR